MVAPLSCIFSSSMISWIERKGTICAMYFKKFMLKNVNFRLGEKGAKLKKPVATSICQKFPERK